MGDEANTQQLWGTYSLYTFEPDAPWTLVVMVIDLCKVFDYDGNKHVDVVGVQVQG